MLDYIRKQLQSKAGLEEEPVQEAQMDEAILECAHLFQEMENLTMDGQASARSFSRMSIPLEDDIEVTSLELNMLDGRVTNIPGDATVQEQAEEEPYKYGDYSRMKTRSEFYTEAYSSLTQFPRETDDEFANRVEAKASKLFKEYKEYIIQEGLFGNDLIKVTDSRVPPRITVDFGECEGKPYYVKMPVLFQVDRKDRITKKQLDTAYIIRDADTLGHGIREAAYKIWGEKVSCDSINKIWKFVTPTRILIPRDPVDKYVAYFEFEIDGESKPDYISMSIPVSKSVKNVKNIKADDFARVTDKKGIAGSDMVSKLDAVRMEEALMKKPKASRFFQEEIDFGDPNAAPDSDPNATDVSVDTGATATPSIDGGSAPAADGAPADGLDATAAPADTNAENKELVATNDVSGDIAEKISDETSADSDINTDDVNLDATTSSDVSDDLGATDEPSEADLQADLGTDTSATDEDTSSTEMSDMDFDNMTVDELLAQGTDKLKGMTIQQLKDFLGSPDGTSPTDVGEGVQEAFFLTRGNIGKELDIHIRKALGILNDNEMEIEDLCDAFRKEGKQCNRVVHKASKMPKVFNEAEIKQLLRLNHCLSDLMAMMRADVKKSELMTVKRMIQAFVSEASGVLKMLETRNKPKEDETVQEGFFNEGHELKPTAERRLMGTPDDRIQRIKKQGLFDKLFGKNKKKEDNSSVKLPEGFPIDADTLTRILKAIDEETKKPVVRMKAKPVSGEIRPDTSVIGGFPVYAPVIPKDYKGNELRFLFQINFKDIPRFDDSLPESGILQMWLDGTDDLDSWNHKFLYYKDTSKPSKHEEVDKSIYENTYFVFSDKINPQSVIEFESISEEYLSMYSFNEVDYYDELFMKHWNEIVTDESKKIKSPNDSYNIIRLIPNEFYPSMNEKSHDNYGDKMGGYPGFVQSDFRDRSFTSDNHILLVQLDSMNQMQWGDCGTAQLFIKKKDLAACKFDKINFDWACG